MNHYDGPIRNTEQQLDHISYTLFSRWSAAAAPFTSHGYMCKNAKPNPFSWAKPTYIGSSSSNFTLQITYLAPLEMLLGEQGTRPRHEPKGGSWICVNPPSVQKHVTILLMDEQWKNLEKLIWRKLRMWWRTVHSCSSSKCRIEIRIFFT
jgi:hypothetical protein